jgi:hypothetical protein
MRADQRPKCTICPGRGFHVDVTLYPIYRVERHIHALHAALTHLASLVADNPAGVLTRIEGEEVRIVV